MDTQIFREVEENYKNNFEKLVDKRFHFAARLFLWSGDDFAKNKLVELKAEYIGVSENEYREKITAILNEEVNVESILFKNVRGEFFIKYPLLKKYNKILFRNLFCETIYGIDLRGIISEQIKKEDFIAMQSALLNDKAAVAALSTHAVNYFYVLDYYLNGEGSFFDPKFFLDIVNNEKIFKSKETSVLKVYLLTHCIIGESAFYSRGIHRNAKIYDKIFTELELIVDNNYENISLDNKVEFLVCAKICKKTSNLEEKILKDVIFSFDIEKKYFAENKKKNIRDAFRKGEHRNVLALMAFYLEKK